ncbi:helix-turn-helix domain-containing protein [Streptococcus parauberis]|uniref:DNA-binding helix-turn-helix protein n=1 Tax=Streptococcus parauberis NCFD 2020 TaxID=873447 RepID=F1Z0Y7_9STRE|nr:helix-turn-helix transcriptional regulator [Streptococcus parauberis]EGE53367.1 DNA-binding helix-turn-helix protein [Streptococcus parauberis NCFD 2020]QBX18303.1 hypothetical protein Javan411_0007 [Streptococcus phage Javan411]QBX27644.1 hypothetical protein Javan400_0046 [Streptococcus phage Javan400]
MSGLHFNGAKLTEVREKRGLTKTELAKKLGVSQQYISDIELNRNKTVSDEFVTRLAIYFQTKKVEFYDYYENINFNFKPSGSRCLKKSTKEFLESLSNFNEALNTIKSKKNITKKTILENICGVSDNYIWNTKSRVEKENFVSDSMIKHLEDNIKKLEVVYCDILNNGKEKINTNTNKRDYQTKEEIQVTTIKNGIEKIQFEDLDDKTLKVIKRLNEKFNLGLTASKEVVSEEILF